MINYFSGEMGPLARCSRSPTVQLSAARFLGSLFSIFNKEYMLSRSDPSPREFMQWTLAQMKTYQLSNELAEQVGFLKARKFVFCSDSRIIYFTASAGFC